MVIKIGSMVFLADTKDLSLQVSENENKVGIVVGEETGEDDDEFWVVRFLRDNEHYMVTYYKWRFTEYAP